MCFSSSRPPATPTPAAAPPPPSLPAEQQRVGQRRKKETKSRFGADEPGTRRDSAGISTTTGGSGLNM